MSTGQFSELAKWAAGPGKLGGSMSADARSVGVAIVVACMFALLGIWLYRLEKKDE